MCGMGEEKRRVSREGEEERERQRREPERERARERHRARGGEIEERVRSTEILETFY